MTVHEFSSINEHKGFAHLIDLPCITLKHKHATAVVSLYGAQVLSYKPDNEKEILWLSPLAAWHNNTPIRGGVPVCWPWFGPVLKAQNPLQQKLANHGLVRNAMWQIKEKSLNENGVSVMFSITLDSLPYYPHATTLNLLVSLSDNLAITLSCDSEIFQQAALHSYFYTDDINNTSLTGLPSTYFDQLSSAICHAASDRLRFEEEVDRLYLFPNKPITLNSLNSIEVSQQGHDTTVVWNPWVDKSIKTQDLENDSFNKFVCIETASLSLYPNTNNKPLADDALSNKKALSLIQYIKAI